MQCPRCKFEQPISGICVECGIVFSKYIEIQERKKEEAKNPRNKSKTFSPPPDNDRNDLQLYAIGAFFILAIFARSMFFLQFPPSLDPYFRIMMLLTMIWLSFRIVPKIGVWMNQLDAKDRDETRLDGVKLYDKKSIIFFMAMGALMFSFLIGALLSGDVECFSGRNQTCHEIYDSVADAGEYWITILPYYFVSLLPLAMGFIGLQMRRERQ